VLLPIYVNHAESVKSLMKVAPNVPNVMLARQELESMVHVRYAKLVSIVPAPWIRLYAPSAHKGTTKNKMARPRAFLAFLVSTKAKLVRLDALNVLLTKRVRMQAPLNVCLVKSAKSLMKVAPNVPNVMLARQELELMVHANCVR
jgi:hypothetical protein